MIQILLALGNQQARTTFQLDPHHHARQYQGKDQLERNTNLNLCHQKAVQKLKQTCANLDQDQQARLAVDFTNCHLQLAGQQIIECHTNKTIDQCTKPMVQTTNSIAFNAYTHFYTHTE